MIPFVKPVAPDIKLFNRLVRKSIKQDRYSNFGPNERALKKYFEELLGYSVVLTCNATCAINALHHLMKRENRLGYLPAFTFPATNLAADRYFVSNTDKNGFADHGKESHSNNYVITTAPFGTIAKIRRPDFADLWIIDNAAGMTPDGDRIKQWIDYGADVVVVSLHATKTLSAGEGGFVVFKDLERAEQFERYINFGDRKYWGSNYKMSELSAALCLSYIQSGIFKEDFDKRLKVSEVYADFAQCKGYQYIDSQQSFYINFNKPASEIIEQLNKYGIEARNYYNPYYGKDKLGKEMSMNGVCLPSWGMDETDLQYIKDMLGSLV